MGGDPRHAAVIDLHLLSCCLFKELAVALPFLFCHRTWRTGSCHCKALFSIGRLDVVCANFDIWLSPTALF